MAAREQGRRPVAMIMEPPANAGLVRVLTGQLESGALDLARTRQETGVDVDGLYAPLLQQWQRAGLLRRDGDWIELTLAGQFWQVNITQALIDWHTQNAMEI
jgi:oxygen-independent coproporphyrinogen-3 oxidase